MFKRSYQNNFVLLGASSLFQFFGITSFWLLFLSQNGMSWFQIGLLESLFHATSLLSEIPSGVLADHFTYKMNLICSRLASILSAIFMLLGNGNFWVYAIGMVINAWSYNFDSGTSDAMLFESAKEAGKENEFLKMTSILSGISEGTRAIGMVLAGFFVHGLLNITYIIQIICSCLALFLIFFMKEPILKIESQENTSIKMIAITVFKYFQQRKDVFCWLMVSECLITLISMFYFYYQNEMSKLDSWQISSVMLISSLVNILGVWLASKLGEKWTAKQVFKVMVPLAALLLISSIVAKSSVYIIIFLISDGLVALFYPIYTNGLQKEFESSVRATMLSVSAMINSVMMVFIFPLMGVFIDHFTFSISFTLLGILLVVISLILSITIKD